MAEARRAILFCTTCRDRTVHEPLGKMMDGHRNLELWGCTVCHGERVKWLHKIDGNWMFDEPSEE